MNSIIYTKANGQNSSTCREDINGDIPEMEEANDINKGDSDCKEDHERYSNVSQKYESD